MEPGNKLIVRILILISNGPQKDRSLGMWCREASILHACRAVAFTLGASGTLLGAFAAALGWVPVQRVHF